ncbi:MAG: hypothetical protein JXR22_05520 [Prolixibacteraceae bacterium]|nr:hypothetical protein [Prolixibacteraceae bacterium]
METNNKNAAQSRIMVRLMVLALLVLVIYTVLVVSAPLRSLHALKHEALTDSVFYEHNKAILEEQSLYELSKTKAVMDAQLVLAVKDTFGIMINLKDSTLSLMFKGINVHSATIYDYRKDPFFDAIHPLAYVKIFSKPLRTMLEYSTIVKEPIIVKKAPKDTLEAIQNAYQPDTLIQNPTYMRLELERNFHLLLVQKNFETDEEKLVEREFLRDMRQQRRHNIIRSFTHPGKASYTPYMVLYLDPEELRSTYRATPEDVLVIIHY